MQFTIQLQENLQIDYWGIIDYAYVVGMKGKGQINHADLIS